MLSLFFELLRLFNYLLIALYCFFRFWCLATALYIISYLLWLLKKVHKSALRELFSIGPDRLWSLRPMTLSVNLKNILRLDFFFFKWLVLKIVILVISAGPPSN